MNLKTLFKKRFTFLHIYSLWGLLAIIAVAIMGRDIASIIAKTNQEYIKAILGEKLNTYWYSGPSIPPATIFVTLLLAIYLLVTTFYLLIYRAYMQRLPITTSQQGNRFIVEFTKTKGQGALLMSSILGLRNDSSGTIRLKPEYQAIAPMREGRFVFDLSMLPTGRYTVVLIDFFIHDFLQLFNVMYTKPDFNTPVLIESNGFKEITTLDVASFDHDGLESQFMSDANESYFASREYRSGDPLKRIHWRHTAKTNKFMVRIPEERTLKSHELNIVLNMYIPFGKQIDQSEIVGKYLEAAIAAIDLILKFPFSKINLYINGGGGQILRELNTFNIDKIHSSILETAVGQTTTKLQQFLADKKLRDTVILTLSSDVPSQEERNVYVFRQSIFLKKTAKAWWLEAVSNKLSPLQFVGLMGTLEKINVFGNARRYFATRKLVKIVTQNELQVTKAWKYL